MIIPNAVLAGATIRNYRRPQKLHVEPVDVGFSYNDPPNKVKQVMKETALATKPPLVVITRIRSVGGRNRSCQTDSVACDKVPQIRDEFVTRIWYAAERHGLNIPFPIRTLYHNPPTKTNAAEFIERYLKYLHGLPSFANLERHILQELAQNATEKAFGVGEKAIAQGDRTEGIYIIVSGMVSITIKQESSLREREVAELNHGDFFGESALSGQNISPVSAIALKDLKVLILPIEAMQIALEQSTRFRQEIGIVMESRRQAIALSRKERNRSSRNGKETSSL